MSWIVFGKNDRLERKSILNQEDPGRGKEVIADNVRRIDNARLIAAAPDMLAALKHVVSNHEKGESSDLNQILAAIEKATS